MTEIAIPDSKAIAGAMLTRAGETLLEQIAAAHARQTLAEKVIDTLKSIGAPGMLISGQKALDAINELLVAAEAEKAKPAPVLRFASYFANESREGDAPSYVEVGKEFRNDPDVHPLYFGPLDPLAVEQAARLTPERISELWNGMPGGHDGFCKGWGYQQFAWAVEDVVRATLLAAPSPTVSDEPAPSRHPNGLTPESLAEEMLDAAIYYSNGHVTDFRERAEDILARNGAPT